MKLLLGIVLYNPNEDEIEKVNKYQNYSMVKQVVIFDNSPESNENKIDNINRDYNWSGQNMGLAVPYNKIIEVAKQDGYDYACILDQDSFFSENQLCNMIEIIEGRENEEDTVLYVPYWDKRNPNKGDLVEIVDYAINSGSFINIKRLSQIKIEYDEKIFLDGLDYDFCWSIREQGGKIRMIHSVQLEHRVGESISRSDFDHHTSERYYLIAHNKKYIWKKHKGFKGSILAFVSNIKLLFVILFYENDKGGKLLKCLKGMID